MQGNFVFHRIDPEKIFAPEAPFEWPSYFQEFSWIILREIGSRSVENDIFFRAIPFISGLRTWWIF